MQLVGEETLKKTNPLVLKVVTNTITLLISI